MSWPIDVDVYSQSASLTEFVSHALEHAHDQFSQGQALQSAPTWFHIYPPPLLSIGSPLGARGEGMCCASHQVEVAHSLSDFRASGPQRVSGVPKKRVFGFQRATTPNTCPTVLPRAWPDSQKMCLKEVGMEIVACHDASCAIGGRQMISIQPF